MKNDDDLETLKLSRKETAMAAKSAAPQASEPSTSPKPTRVQTPEARLSFPNLFQPKSYLEGQEPKYSCTLLFSDKTKLQALRDAVDQAKADKWGPKEKWPKNLRSPFRDGNEKSELQGYENCIFITASSKQPPGVVNQRVEYITEKSGGIYAGCYVRATINAYAYDTAGNRGVAFGLQNIQKTRDGQPFSGRKKAEEDFDAVEDSSEDQSSYDSGTKEKAEVEAEDDIWN
jgi:hypothetical protein